MSQLGESGIEYVYETDAISGTNQVSSNENVPGAHESVSNPKTKANPFGQLAEYELASHDPQKETLEQKLQKLWLEVIEFQEEVKMANEKTSLEDPSQLAITKTGELLKKLDSLKPMAGDASLKINLTDPQGTLHKKLLTDIEKFKSKKVEDVKSEESKIEYQLFYPSKDSKVDRLSKISNLESRLAHLNHILGRIPDIPTPLIIDAANKSLLEIVSNLVNKSKTLESQNWNEVENKAGMVLKRMDQIAEKRDIMEQKSKMDKISELYHIMLKWQKLSGTLPQVVDRLATLKILHEQSQEFKQLLGHLEVTQQQIGIQLKGHSELLKSVQSDIVKNLLTIKNNCENIESKLNNASQK